MILQLNDGTIEFRQLICEIFVIDNNEQKFLLKLYNTFILGETAVPDILKITSPAGVKNKILNMPKNKPADAVFDMWNPIKVSKHQNDKSSASGAGTDNALINNLNNLIYKPLTNHTMVQSEHMRKLILYAKLFEVSSGIISESFIESIFIKPEELLDQLLKREEADTIFKGDFFDTLRLLAKYPGQQKLHEEIISLLKYFDCYVNRDNSLSAIIKISSLLCTELIKEDAQILKQQAEKLNLLILDKSNDYKEIIKYIKNDFMPVIKKLSVKYTQNGEVYNKIMSIVHYIVRYDKSDIKLLEESVINLGNELKPLTSLSDDDIIEMKEQLLKNAEEMMQSVHENGKEDKGKKAAVIAQENDIAALLTKGLDNNGPAKISNIAQNLLLYILQSESPLMNLMHFMIPVRFMDDNTYGEFLVDKDCFGRRGDAKEAKNIFFTIQSDIYGTFEVDLLSKDKNIDLNIKCPVNLVDALKDTKQMIRDIIEKHGCRLMEYRVEEYKESKTILEKFPKLSLRKVGIDVKI